MNMTNVAQQTVVTSNVLPPANAVLNIPLRMRIIGDMDLQAFTYNGCSNPVFGQVEDYAVTIVSSLSVADVEREKTSIYKNTQNSIVVNNTKNIISTISLFDVSGRLLKKYENVNHKDFISEPLHYTNQIIIVALDFTNDSPASQKIKF